MSSIKTRWVNNLLNKAFGEDPEEPDYLACAGDFEIVANKETDARTMHIICPGCKTVSVLRLRPVAPKDQQHPSWDWDGDIALPTLNPSIHHVGCWHGWLKRGELVLA